MCFLPSPPGYSKTRTNTHPLSQPLSRSTRSQQRGTLLLLWVCGSWWCITITDNVKGNEGVICFRIKVSSATLFLFFFFCLCAFDLKDGVICVCVCSHLCVCLVGWGWGKYSRLIAELTPTFNL